MQLLFISSQFPSNAFPNRGVCNFHTLKGLEDSGHATAVVCPVPWTDRLRTCHRPSPLPKDQVKDHRLALYPTYYFTPKILRRAYGWFMTQSVKRAIADVRKFFRPDVVLSYWAHPDGRCAINVAKQMGVPAVLIVGGSDVLILTKNRVRRRLVVGVLNDADAIIAVSGDIRDRIVELGVCGEKVHVVRNGVDTCVFRRKNREESRQMLGVPPDIAMLLWVGRITEVKGLPVLMQALEQLNKEGLSIRLYLVGSGDKTKDLVADVNRRGISHIVHFVGEVPHFSLAPWYCAADITVLPSFSEGTPGVLLESIACGTPFIASRVGGIPDIATPGIDRLVPARDFKALASAIREQIGSLPSSARRQFIPDDYRTSSRRLTKIIEPLLSRN